MELTIHEQAVRNFDKRALVLRQAVRPGVRKPRPSTTTWTPDIYTTSLDADDLVGPMHITRGGSAPFIVEEDRDRIRMLKDGNARHFNDLSKSLWSAISPKGAVSLKATQKLAVTWLFDLPNGSTLSQYCLDKLRPLVRRYTVWIPIAELHIQSAFTLGAVDFRSITREVIASWTRKTERYHALHTDDRKVVDEYHDKLANELRGHAAGVIVVEAEPEAAKEVALERVEDALSMLRLFSDAAMFPNVRSHLAPQGQENIEKYRIIMEVDGNFNTVMDGIRSDIGMGWKIDNRELQQMRDMGLDRLGKLLASEKRTEFESAALIALRLYSESAREKRITTRLVLMLSALEGLFLKNSNEPIQQNLGERLAYMMKDASDERIAVTKLVRSIYALRSRFVHHSEHIELDADLSEFTHLAWDALLEIVSTLDVFTTHELFIDHLDHLKMGGKAFRPS